MCKRDNFRKRLVILTFFRKKFFRISKIYRNVIDRKSGSVVEKQLIRDNHSEVMFDYELIPKELMR